MQPILIIGIIIFAGFIFGEIAVKLKLPKITGYILGGILLDPDVSHFIPQDFITHTTPVTNIALSLIAFSVGGSLLYSRIKKLGKGILYITIFESEFAFIIVTLGFLAITPFLGYSHSGTWFVTFVPMSLLIASLASPTDPSATLAVVHEYKAKGNVTSTILGVAALDDVFGIVNFSFAVVIAETIILHQTFNAYSTIIKPLIVISGALLLGGIFGFLFNIITQFIKRESGGVFIVVIIGLLALCFGFATLLGVDELLATMTMGAVVANFNRSQEKIFQILERYTDELIFILFFTLCGMQLNFSVLSKCFILILIFAVFRVLGKLGGTIVGASLSKSSLKVKRYTIGGLIPQGGIIVGLALMLKQNPAFSGHLSDIIISIIIGSTVVHELIGPIFAKIALKKAGEIK